MFHNFLTSYLLQILDQRRREKSGGNCHIQRDGRLTWTNQNDVVLICPLCKKYCIKKEFNFNLYFLTQRPARASFPLKEIANKTTFSWWIVLPIFHFIFLWLIRSLKKWKKEKWFCEKIWFLVFHSATDLWITIVLADLPNILVFFVITVTHRNSHCRPIMSL